MASWIYKLRDNHDEAGESLDVSRINTNNRGCRYVWVHRIENVRDRHMVTDINRRYDLGAIATSDLAYFYQYIGDSVGGLSMWSTNLEKLAVAFKLWDEGNPYWIEAWDYMQTLGISLVDTEWGINAQSKWYILEAAFNAASEDGGGI